MERQVALAQGKPGEEEIMLDKETFTLAYSGRLQAARKMTRRAADVAVQGGRRKVRLCTQ